MTAVYAYYYPGWHLRDGAREWDAVRDARPYFPGHEQPHVPLLGYQDTSLPQTLVAQAALANAYGVDGFLFDWYWKEGRPAEDESLEALLAADTGFPFAIMWGFKTPRRRFPIHSLEDGDDGRWAGFDPERFTQWLEYCNERYFSRPEYIRIGGKPHVTLYYLDGLVAHVGATGVRETLAAGRAFMADKGGIHLTGIATRPVDDALGFDALTGYNYLPDFTPGAPVLQDYEEMALRCAASWREIEQRSGVPFIPNISCGWDATPRGVRKDRLVPELGFPWTPIITGATPERFGAALDRAIAFARERHDIVHVCSWNEWSEGNHLEPDTRYGYGFLEHVRARTRQVQGSSALGP